MKKYLLILAICLAAGSVNALAQDNKTPEQREKEFYEAVQKQVENLEESLKLEDWQVFYVDSILTHDYKAMQDEFAEMSAAKMSNSDLFYDVQDKWMERIYQSLQKVFTPEQWAQYQKTGAARDKKARDKRAAKKNANTGKK